MQLKYLIFSIHDGSDYVDWGTTDLIVGSTASSHANLSGLTITSGTGTYKHVSDLEPLQLPSFTTVQRDAFATVLGMMIANSTTNTTQKFSGGIWADF